ncbi:DEAD/DEAH box helicase [Thalassobacillus sp. CUG 92003]|uniref:DEAD/DEAH box helicase n=1 Tax=Thalassobacillus sp. CUG 92003 TaxID=2736641 RepID=UPI0015E6EE2B|nr:DEAD/DEAH box helicase [Thalassobacillus sp. CUG 92003]
MQSYILQASDIRNITGSIFYERGKQYYQKGKVFGLSHNQSIRSWRAVVTGKRDYEVRVFFFENDDLEATCECPAYESYYSCKHIAAVLLAIRERAVLENGQAQPSIDSNENRKKSQIIDRDFSKRLTEGFRAKREQNDSHNQQALQFQYYLHVHSVFGHDSLSLEVKMGEHYLYVIKNIRELISHLAKGSPYRITNRFRYDPSEHVLSEEDGKIVQLLSDILEQEQFYESQSVQEAKETRTLLIPPFYANQLLAALSDRACSIMDREGEWPGPFLHQEIPGMTFYVSKERSRQYQLNMSTIKNYHYLKAYSLLYDNGHFYQIGADQLDTFDTLLSLLPYRSNANHPINQRDMEDVLTYVLPELEQIATIQYAESARESIVHHTLQAGIKLDFAGLALTADLYFQYGDHVLRPFQNKERSSDVSIQRDAETEQWIMQQIEDADFKFDGEAVYLDDEAKITQFVMETIPLLQSYADIYLSSAVKHMITSQKAELTPSVSLSSEGNWLDIQFAMDGITNEDVHHVMQAVVEKKKYYRLSDGAVLSLESPSLDRFRELIDELDVSADDIQDGSLQVAKARGMQVEETLQTSSDERDPRYHELIERLQTPNTMTAELPDRLQADLRDYQLTGFRWMKMLAYYELGGILADDMGLGKTLQSIAFLLSEKEEGKLEQPALIIAPASLVYNWKKEIEKFAPDLSVSVITGEPEKRQALITQEETNDVHITSYPLLRQDHHTYLSRSYHAVFLDEAQAIKNDTTKTAQASRAIKAQHRFALSGTPIENSISELWSIFRTIMPGFYKNKKQFLNLKPEKIARMTRPFILRRMKQDVLTELPDKIETTQYSQLTRDQKEVYLAYLEKIQAEIAETIATKGFQRGKLEILAGLTRLRQICCHPGLFLENYEGQSGKLEQLKELALELKAGGHRVLIFSQFSTMLTMLYQELSKIGMTGFYLDGGTPSNSRVDMVEQFNQGERDAFFISLKAGGTGLNLTGADTVILYDLWWNPAIEEQAAGRAHRIGQEKVVQVIRMISEGTIEERIHKLQQQKRDLVDQIIQPGEAMLNSLTEEEVLDLL